ncbi:OmpH family outer membrane protein [Candidatus Persebacteraceae bacterium Df01]|jgi:outer membrane protein|uniref:OmpH family outer membrane protein n=1 Tax=Candidatus Doriopsillibacter californiensis TaxID=2970740 RepID=A0ABT7QMW9_9GAMM|nr:OmpH family outer membrane protein [Candidatus Persebacteraceae bacterium Df01]
MKIKTAILITALTIAISGGAQAQESQVAFVNFERIYQESKVVKAVRDEINVTFRSREKKLEEQGDKLRALQEELQKESLTFSEAQKESRISEIEQKGRQFERDRRALLEDRGAMLQEQRRTLDVEIAKIIEAIAREKKYSMVLNPYLTLPISDNRTLTHNILLYADASADITGDVIERFDKQARLNISQ